MPGLTLDGAHAFTDRTSMQSITLPYADATPRPSSISWGINPFLDETSQDETSETSLPSPKPITEYQVEEIKQELDGFATRIINAIISIRDTILFPLISAIPTFAFLRNSLRSLDAYKTIKSQDS